MDFAFYGRVSTEDQQDPEASRAWRLTRSRALIEPAGGQIVAEFFDVGLSRSLPWKRRSQAARLLAALRDPDRGFDAVVIGEPQRAFYGNRFGFTFPLFEHYGIALWVPEVGGGHRPQQRRSPPHHGPVRRHEHGRTQPHQDPNPVGDGNPSRHRRPLPRWCAALRLPSGRRRPTPKPEQSSRRPAPAPPRT